MAIVFFSPAVYDAALSVVSFALPLFLLELRVDPVTMGYLLAMTSLVQIFIRIPAGLMTGRIGNAAGMVVGCVLLFAAASVFALTPDASVVACVACAQVLQGLARASFWPANQSYVLDMARLRPLSMVGPYNFVVTLGSMTGPLLAAWVASRFGYRASFWVFGALALLAATPVLARSAARLRGLPLPGMPGGGRDDAAAAADLSHVPTPQDHVPVRTAAMLATVIRSPGVWLGALCCVVSVIPFAVTTTFLPVLLRQRGISAGSISLLATLRMASLALFSLLSGAYLEASHRPHLLVLATLVGAVGMALVPALANTPLLALLMVFFGFCGAGMHNVQMAAAGESVAPRLRPLAMAVVGTLGMITMATIPIVHGAMAARGLLEQAFPVTAFALALVGSVAWRWSLALRRSRPAAPLAAESAPPSAPTTAW